MFGGIETETYARIRCRKPHHRDICVGLSALKHNLRTYFRAVALNIIFYFAPTPSLSKSLYIANAYKCNNMYISNSSTMVLLAKVNALGLLLDYIGKITIPRIVYGEIRGKDSFEVMLIEKEIKNNRILIADVNKKYYKDVMKQFKLDEGEAAAYALFNEKKGKSLMTDDGELIKLCKIEGIPFIVAMSVIVKLFKKGKIGREESLEKLSKLYGYGRYSEEIYKYFISEVK